MYSSSYPSCPTRLLLRLLAILPVAASALLQAQSLTVTIGDPPAPPGVQSTNVLVGHGEFWGWRRGTNEPQADWRTAADASLDATWLQAAGGFGYGDPGIVGEATTLDGMLNVHTTLYTRRSFHISSPLDAAATLSLRMDYDDGFVVYLDGNELARRNVPGAAGTAVANTATTGGVSHEASCCNTPNPATVIPIGLAAPLLAPGDHVLSVIGVNQTVGSSDFHLIVDLFTTVGTGTNTPASPVTRYPGYALSVTNLVSLSGTNTVAGAVRVTVDGHEAAFNSVAGTWTHAATLAPGWNSLYIAAHSASGQILSNITQEVVYQQSQVTLGGTLAASARYATPGTVIHVTNALSIPAGLTLEFATGVVVLTDPGQGITARADGHLLVRGTDAARVYFNTFGGTNTIWGPLSANGTNASIEVHFADVAHAQVNAQQGATGLIEDCELHDYDFPSGGTLGRPLMMCNFATSFVARRNHHMNYYENLVRNGIIQVEGSVFEHIIGDGLDFDSAQPGSFIRRSTFRHGNLGNVDAVDIGPGDLPGSTDTIIESCLMWDFPFDKGVSIGDNGSSHGIVVSNCVVYGCDSGVAVKDSCSAIIANCTFVDNDFGINLKAKFPATPPGTGGQVTNSFNNLIWDSKTTPIWVTNNPIIVVSYTDIAGTNWPGLGNFSADPLFVDAPRRNYRLQPGSPAIGAGLDGTTLGAHYPLGGIGRPPLRLAVLSATTNSVSLAWVDDTENEDGVIVERSLDGLAWFTLALTAPEAIAYTDTSVTEGTTYSYRVRTTNYVGLSPAGNVARATTASSVNVAGGPVTQNTTWGGRVLVLSAVTVPAPFTLTLLPGTTVLLTNGVGLTASGGGHIEVQGTAEQPVTFSRAETSFTRWGDLTATGAGSTLVVRHAVLTRGRVRANSGGTALVEDSELSQMTTTGIIGGSSGALFTVRRCHVHDYEDIDLVATRTVAEDSLFERANSDIFELQGSPVGSVLRRCTFRTCLNPNSDAVDMNGCNGVLIDSCLIYDVTDKGISSGSATSASDPSSFGLVVSNTLVYAANTGIAIKDNGTASLYNNTFAAVTEGIAAYGKFTAQGGHVTNGFNNLIWGVTTSLRLTNGATALLAFSDLEHTNYPGAGNISADPHWKDAAAKDYLFLAGSPCLGAGLGGANIGASLPAGAPMAPSHPTLDSFRMTPAGLELQFWADSARTTTLQSSPSLPGGTWSTLLHITGLSTPSHVRFTNAPAADGFYRIRTMNR